MMVSTFRRQLILNIEKSIIDNKYKFSPSNEKYIPIQLPLSSKSNIIEKDFRTIQKRLLPYWTLLICPNEVYNPIYNEIELSGEGRLYIGFIKPHGYGHMFPREHELFEYNRLN